MIKVIFRKWRDGGDIIALFPEIPADCTGYECLSYMHIGQHGAANPTILIARTVPAAPDEYAELLDELKCIGYTDLQIVQRFSHNAFEKRWLQIKF